ncbi:hypothetical protein IIQ44_19740 [Acinetobacter oleivorans]|uniref:hypothetical protein n=1 Tax=Acinetobacter oleivorans TaxID=1148157 RepID=UPI00178CC097|nr:hypothetical protein [Acinetobacter oleivorans]MBE2174124.1 hypothetical protein [Acinetobacter oleivorans]
MSRYDIHNLIGQIYKNGPSIGSAIQKIANNPAAQRAAQIGSQIRKISMDPAFKKATQDIAAWMKQHEEIAPHMEQILDEMKKNGNYSEALKTIRYRQLLRLIVNSEKVEDKNLLNLINQEVFQKPILTYFEKIDLGTHFQKRKSLIEEAFQLYKYEFYAGCLTLLLSQFEGIITDYLLFKKVIKKENNKLYDVAKLATAAKAREAVVNGLATKIKLAKDINASFMRLEIFNFDNDENQKFSNERNDILHGSNIANFNAERCFVVFIWIDSILGSIYTEEVTLKN